MIILIKLGFNRSGRDQVKLTHFALHIPLRDVIAGLRAEAPDGKAFAARIPQGTPDERHTPKRSRQTACIRLFCIHSSLITPAIG
jgi:hypothetical protein